MPCFDAETDREVAENRAKVPELQERVNTLTRLLCEAGKIAMMGGKPSDELVNFWLEHAKEDAARGESWFVVD